MVGELLAIFIAAVGGLIGVRGETWNSVSRKFTRTGWVAIVVVVCATLVAGGQIIASHHSAKIKEARELRMSYQALINVYGPLSMWFDDFGLYGTGIGPDNSIDYEFPPPISAYNYKKLRNSEEVRSNLTDYLSQGVKIDNRPFRNDVAKSFAALYRVILKRLDQSINLYGPHISGETLDHLIRLRSHSLFRGAEEFQSRRDKQCNGWIDQIALDFTDENIDAVWKIRCQEVFNALLTRITRDELPPFAIPSEMENLHKKHCEIIGYKRPYCRWADQRGTAGISSKAP